VNPFDFYGPQFLVFYIAFSIFVFIVTAIARRFVDRAVIDRPVDPAQVVSDPYLIAYLRGGAPEAARVAAISLVDRELLSVTGSKLKAHDHVKKDHARHPLEQQILLKYKNAGEASDMFADGNIRNACDAYEAKLRELGLLPDHRVTAARKALYLVMAAVLALVSIIKIVVALSRGRSNVAFLIILTVIAIAPRATSFPTIRIPDAGGLQSYVNMCAGWNLLVEVGVRLGIDLDKPQRARKVGNEFVG